jgi:hypothetical protein
MSKAMLSLNKSDPARLIVAEALRLFGAETHLTE